MQTIQAIRVALVECQVEGKNQFAGSNLGNLGYLSVSATSTLILTLTQENGEPVKFIPSQLSFARDFSKDRSGWESQFSAM